LKKSQVLEACVARSFTSTTKGASGPTSRATALCVCVCGVEVGGVKGWELRGRCVDKLVSSKWKCVCVCVCVCVYVCAHPQPPVGFAGPSA
jgi:hypothetical protein